MKTPEIIDSVSQFFLFIFIKEKHQIRRSNIEKLEDL